MIVKGKNPEPNTITYGYRTKRFFLNNYAYIPILKNAHRLTATVVVAHGFQQDDNVDLKNKIKLVTLRDPIERWFAGISQMLYLHFPKLEINENILDLLTRIIVLDGHSSSQSNYLSGIDTDECIFFNMDQDNYIDTFQHYCARQFGGKVDLANPLLNKPKNFSTQVPIYKQIKSELQKYCTDTFRARLKKYYAEDYELLNTVTFYKGNT